MKIPIFIFYIFLLNGFLSMQAMEKEKKALVSFKNDEQMQVSISLLKKCKTLKHLLNPRYCPRPLKEDPIIIPSITRREFRSVCSVLLNRNKSEEASIRNLEKRKDTTLAQTIRTADYLGCTVIITPALQILMNKLKDNPANSELLSTIAKNICLADLPKQSIKKLKNGIFDQLAQNPKTLFNAALIDHGEHIENIASNDRFVVTQSNQIVRIFDLLNQEDWQILKLNGNFVDVALSDNNHVAIGYSDGTVQLRPLISETSIEHDIKSITHRGLTKVANNSQGTRIATGSYPDNVIKIWDGATAAQLWKIEADWEIKKLSFPSESKVKYITYTCIHSLAEPIQHYNKGYANLDTRTYNTRETFKPNLIDDFFRNYATATDIIANKKYLNIYSYKETIDTLFPKLSLEEGLLLTIVFDHTKKNKSRYPLYRYPGLLEIYKQSTFAKELVSKRVALNAFWYYWPF